MTTALSVRSETLPAFASLPRLSGSLAYYVGGDRVVGGDLSAIQGTPGAKDIDEARGLIQQANHLCRPPTEALIEAWCKKLIPNLPRAPVGPDELRRVVDGIMLACGDLPFGVWTAETAGEALKTLEWWPPPAKVRAILGPFAAKLLRVRDGLARVIAGSLAPDATNRPTGPTPESEAHVAGVVQAFVAERSFNDPTHVQAKPAVKAHPLSDGALLAVWEKAEADGTPGASIRLAMLRKRIAEDRA